MSANGNRLVQLRDLKIPELKSILRKCSLPLSGRKDQLLDRIDFFRTKGDTSVRLFITRVLNESCISIPPTLSSIPSHLRIDGYNDPVSVIAYELFTSDSATILNFALTPDMVARIWSTGPDRTGAGSFHVHLWAYSLSDPQQTHTWPMATSVLVNSTVAPLKQRKLVKNGGCTKVKGFSEPLDVLGLLRPVGQANTIEVTSRDQEPFALVCQLTQQVGVEEVANRVVANTSGKQHPSKEGALQAVKASFVTSSSSSSSSSPSSSSAGVEGDGDDDDVFASSARVSLWCPIGLCPISVPVRGRQCTHLQCFDLKTFLALNEKNSVARFRCGVCSNKITVADLVVDAYFSEIIGSQAPENAAEESEVNRCAREVEIQPDGSWCLVGGGAEPPQRSSSPPTTAPPNLEQPLSSSSSSPAPSSTASSSSSTSHPLPHTTSSRSEMPPPSVSSSSSTIAAAEVAPSTLLAPPQPDGSALGPTDVPTILALSPSQFVDLSFDDDSDGDEENSRKRRKAV